ncbi:phasin family protein [Bradyrhizobium sp.]|uniref:phasin family protein n=1 Tax=Bradyrhizobium sp. TaxID=376 RepID=UPI0025C110E3|nr:phasin family protein [Bradyrhizobium sp.]
MSTTDHNTPAGKQGRRNRKAARNSKPGQPPSPQADQLQPAEEPIAATAAPPEPAPIEAAAAADAAPVEMAATEDAAPIEAEAPADTAPIGADAPAAPAPVSLQTIANAYGDYTRRSLEETRSFVERLKGAKSLDKAMEVQTEFAHHAFEIFVAESQKIYGLHKELARQTMKPLEGLMNRPNRDPR